MNSICIIIPFYNEAKRFPDGEFLKFLQNYQDICFCLVDDGSSDGTTTLLKSLQEKAPERINLTTLPENKGKAAAVQAGIKSALQHFPASYFGY
ncbi:MAG: glycosyltransferase, partial [Bacteroidales bacterium]